MLTDYLVKSLPRLPQAIGRIGPIINWTAVAALFCGDWCLAVHAGNFFAKTFIPKSRNHLQDASTLGVDPSRVCLWCWHNRRQLCVEDEVHVLFECPAQSSARTRFFQDVSAKTRDDIQAAGSGRGKTLAALASTVPSDWEAFGAFAGRSRQRIRLKRRHFEHMQSKIDKIGFTIRKEAWKKRGNFPCRHGVLFARPQLRNCPCMSRNFNAENWENARMMVAIDHDLKELVVVPFDRADFQRLGILQGETRRLNYV